LPIQIGSSAGIIGKLALRQGAVARHNNGLSIAINPVFSIPNITEEFLSGLKDNDFSI
jgi:hypothetical protein